MADLSEGSNVSGHSAARAEAGCVGTEWQQNTETLNTRSRREKVAAKSDIFTINQITVGPGGHSFLTTCSSPHTPLICHPAHTLWHLPHVKKQTSLDTLPPSSIYYKPHKHLNKDSSSPILSRYCKNLIGKTEIQLELLQQLDIAFKISTFYNPTYLIAEDIIA